jgi:hypothetical protein
MAGSPVWNPRRGSAGGSLPTRGHDAGNFGVYPPALGRIEQGVGLPAAGGSSRTDVTPLSPTRSGVLSNSAPRLRFRQVCQCSRTAGGWRGLAARRAPDGLETSHETAREPALRVAARPRKDHTRRRLRRVTTWIHSSAQVTVSQAHQRGGARGAARLAADAPSLRAGRARATGRRREVRSHQGKPSEPETYSAQQPGGTVYAIRARGATSGRCAVHQSTVAGRGCERRLRYQRRRARAGRGALVATAYASSPPGYAAASWGRGSCAATPKRGVSQERRVVAPLLLEPRRPPALVAPGVDVVGRLHHDLLVSVRSPRPAPACARQMHPLAGPLRCGGLRGPPRPSALWRARLMLTLAYGHDCAQGARPSPPPAVRLLPYPEGLVNILDCLPWNAIVPRIQWEASRTVSGVVLAPAVGVSSARFPTRPPPLGARSRPPRGLTRRV